MNYAMFADYGAGFIYVAYQVVSNQTNLLHSILINQYNMTTMSYIGFSTLDIAADQQAIYRYQNNLLFYTSRKSADANSTLYVYDVLKQVHVGKYGFADKVLVNYAGFQLFPYGVTIGEEVVSVDGIVYFGSNTEIKIFDFGLDSGAVLETLLGSGKDGVIDIFTYDGSNKFCLNYPEKGATGLIMCYETGRSKRDDKNYKNLILGEKLYRSI